MRPGEGSISTVLAVAVIAEKRQRQAEQEVGVTQNLVRAEQRGTVTR